MRLVPLKWISKKIESKCKYYDLYTHTLDTITTMGRNNMNMNIPNEMKHQFKKTIAAAAERARANDEKFCRFVVVSLAVICSSVLALLVLVPI